MSAVPQGFLSNYQYSQPGDLTTKKGIRNALSQQYEYQQWQKTDAQGQREATRNPTFSGYLAQANGGTPSENAGLTRSYEEPIGGAYAGARDQLANNVARTHNSAGYTSALGQLTRHQGQDMGTAALGVQNEKFARKMAGLQGLAQMFGVDTNYLAGLNNNQQGTLGIGNNVEARRKGVLGTIAGVENLFPGLRPQ